MKKSLYILASIIFLFSCNRHNEHEAYDHDPDIVPASAKGPVKMQLQAGKQDIRPGDSVSLRFTPLQAGNIASLETLHEKKIHLIIVSEDLSFFQHLHLDKPDSGSYSINTIFPAGGKYLAIADYKPEGQAQQHDSFSINVNGRQQLSPMPAAEQLMSATDGYTLQLLHKKLIAGKQGMLVLKINKDGNPVLPETVQSYLGERAHLISIKTDNKTYVHAHSMSDPMSYWFMLDFPEVGLYKVWVQFQTANKVHTAPFFVAVTSQ